MTLADWAGRFRTTAKKLGAAFLDQTGMSFPRWRAQLRMDVARRLLRLGDPPGVVSRQLGYAGPAAFSIAFSRAHGIPPREYQRRETRRPEAVDEVVPRDTVPDGRRSEVRKEGSAA